MSVEGAFGRLEPVLEGEVRYNERMQRHTSYRIGGPASLFVTCDSVADLRLTAQILGDEAVPWVVVGRGSNVLVSDRGYKGAVVTLGSQFKRFSFDAANRLHAGAGVSLQRLVTEAFDRGLSGLEFAVGIPGCVGGAVSMNAGTASHWIGGIVEEVVTYRPGYGLVRYAGRDITWGYRGSNIPAREFILEAGLVLRPGNEEAVKAAMEAMLARRKETQPFDRPTCGSVFRNPPDGPKGAGALIEECGLKGYTVGRAQVSTKHANFIVNLGGATATQVTQVITHVMSEVKRTHGIELQPEVKFLGFPL